MPHVPPMAALVMITTSVVEALTMKDTNMTGDTLITTPLLTSDGRELPGIPECLKRNLYLKTYENGRFIRDAYFRLSRAECDLVDKWIVAIGHPVAFEPGTQESRIVALVQEFGK